MVGNIRVENLHCAGIFRMLHTGHLFYVTLLYRVPNSNAGELSNSGRERAGCGPWPFSEEALLPYTSWNGNSSIIYRLCLLSFLWDKQASGKVRVQMKEFLKIKVFICIRSKNKYFSPLSLLDYFYFNAERHKCDWAGRNYFWMWDFQKCKEQGVRLEPAFTKQESDPQLRFPVVLYLLVTNPLSGMLGSPDNLLIKFRIWDEEEKKKKKTPYHSNICGEPKVPGSIILFYSSLHKYIYYLSKNYASFSKSWHYIRFPHFMRSKFWA